MVEFFRTGMGHQFYEGTMPKLADACQTIADAMPTLTRIAEALDREAPRPEGTSAERETIAALIEVGEELLKLLAPEPPPKLVVNPVDEARARAERQDTMIRALAAIVAAKERVAR